MVKDIKFRGKCDFVEASADYALVGDVGLLENENIVQEYVTVPTNYGNTVMTLINSTITIQDSTSLVTYKQLVVNTANTSVDVDINGGKIITVPLNCGITLCWLQPLSEWIQVH